MTRCDLRAARLSSRLTQKVAAERLSLTQAYLSMVESGERSVTSTLARKAAQLFQFPPTALPLQENNSISFDSEERKADLGSLGYPGFRYLGGTPSLNPAFLLFDSLSQSNLDTRVVEALPWLAYQFVDMDWEWLVAKVKLHDCQNRLGFVVTLSLQMARKTGHAERSMKLVSHQAALERSRLVREDTLCRDSMTHTERNWLKEHRTSEAKHWNILTDLQLKDLAYATA